MLFTSQERHSDCLVPAKEKYEIYTTWLKIQFSSYDMYQFCCEGFIINGYFYINVILGEKIGNRSV